MSRWTREQLAAKGFTSDRGGVVRLPAAEWAEKHGQDFDSGGVESRHAGASFTGLPRPVADSRPVTNSRSSARPAVNLSPTIPKERRLTKVEACWGYILSDRYPGATIIPQFRVRISPWDAATVSHYTCDFAVFSPHPEARTFWQCVLWEVKDSRRKGHSDELTRPKMARAQNPWIVAVYLAVWDGRLWKERRLA